MTIIHPTIAELARGPVPAGVPVAARIIEVEVGSEARVSFILDPVGHPAVVHRVGFRTEEISGPGGLADLIQHLGAELDLSQGISPEAFADAIEGRTVTFVRTFERLEIDGVPQYDEHGKPVLRQRIKFGAEPLV